MNFLQFRGSIRLFLGMMILALGTVSALANHPVLVEGNCNNPPAGNPASVALGTCGDYDGDGRIGTAEDMDGDRVFGTITAAVGTIGGANLMSANQNGTVTIVTSGTFPEVITITGNITLQAAPGVVADLDAVLQGDPGNGVRQTQPGIIVNAPADRYVVIRNITSKNWTSGIQINSVSRVAIESCKFENNVNYGVEVTGNARVTIAKSEIHATGFRQGGGNFPTANQPMPGKGIEFDDNSSGTVFLTTVTGSFAAGISNQTNKSKNVCVNLVNVFDNSPNFQRVSPSKNGCDNSDDDDK